MTPSATLTSTPHSSLLTPTFSFSPTPTCSVSQTITPSFLDIFTIDRNLYYPSQGAVSITVGTSETGGNLSLDVYNTAGEHIVNLINTYLTSGYPTAVIPWNGRNKAGNLCASGVYIIVLEEPFEQKFRKVLLVR